MRKYFIIHWYVNLCTMIMFTCTELTLTDKPCVYIPDSRLKPLRLHCAGFVGVNQPKLNLFYSESVCCLWLSMLFVIYWNKLLILGTFHQVEHCDRLSKLYDIGSMWRLGFCLIELRLPEYFLAEVNKEKQEENFHLTSTCQMFWIYVGKIAFQGHFQVSCVFLHFSCRTYTNN